MAQEVLSITQLNEYIRGKMDADALLNSVAVRVRSATTRCIPPGITILP